MFTIFATKKRTLHNPKPNPSEARVRATVLTMPYLDSSGNVEVAVLAAKEMYVSELTPPSSPFFQRASMDDIFQPLFQEPEEEKEMHRQMQLAERSLSFVVENCERYSLDNPNTRPVNSSRSPVPHNPDDLPIHKPHAYPCRNTNDPLPPPPSKWPQAPLMLRPTPNSNNKVRGIRFASSNEYLDFSGFCAGCILPINTGAEETGKSLVIDFETTYFVGTLLMRIKQAPAADPNNQMSTSYFDGKKRRFQAIIQGRFKQELSMCQCVTGQMFDRPSGKLPAKWIVSTAIRFISTLSPQLEATIDGVEPKFLAPLAATAHSILQYPIVHEDLRNNVDDATCSPEERENRINYSFYRGAKDLERSVEEPPANSEHSILPDVLQASNSDTKHSTSSSSVTSRQRVRKACLNKVTSKRQKEPKFSTQKEYCFEFYQHLLLFGDDLAIDLGRSIGQISLAQPLNGQPLKFMAGLKKESDTTSAVSSLEPLWSFDIWHANLFPLADAYHHPIS